MSDIEGWTPHGLRHEAKSLRKLGKANQIETPYGPGEIATYQICAEGMEWSADEIERLDKQVEALQAKVHLCAAYDKLEADLAEAEALLLDVRPPAINPEWWGRRNAWLARRKAD